MTNISPGTSITEDGEFSIAEDKRAPVVQIKGDLGGGTVTFGIVDAAGDFAPLLDTNGLAISTSIAGVLSFATPERLAVKLEGATSPDFAVNLI